jgi:branched-chain amino acid transport system permease protein
MSAPILRALALIGLAVLLAVPLFVAGAYFKFLLILVFIYSIVAIGLNILVGYAGQFSLGHAALMAVGAYGSALISISLESIPVLAATGANVWIGMVAGSLAAGIAGTALAFPALRLKGPYLAMVTVAFGWMTWKVLLNWTSLTGGDLGVASIPSMRIGSKTFDIDAYYYFAGGAVAGAFLLQRNLARSDFGRKLRAIKHSEIAAASVGVDVHREKVVVFVLSAVFAGAGGALFAHIENFINPDDFQFYDSVFFLLAVLFGGAGTLIGPLIGAAFLTIAPEILQDAEHYRLIIFGVIILATLYALPNGVAGALLARLRREQEPRPSPRRAASGAPSGSRAPALAAVAQRPILTASGLAKAFGGVRALADVSLALEAGKVHALIGPNGAGKTTLVNILSGYYRPDEGHVAIDGRRIDLHSLHNAAQLGVVRTFQNIRLFGDMTAREHVMVGAELGARASMLDALFNTPRRRREQARREAIADELLALVGLAAHADLAGSTLAYGHRRLLEIARALAASPRALLMDEPAAGLVAGEIEALSTLILQLREQGLAIVLVEHHMDLVMQVSDVVTVLDYGQVIAHGEPAAVQRDPAVIEAYLGGADLRSFTFA